MWIDKINLKSFRNYSNSELSFSDGINIFIGDNAQGKTNLLESLYYLANATSFKKNRDKDIISFNKSSMKLSGLIRKGMYFKDVVIEVDAYGKKISVNGVKYERNKDLKALFSVVLFTPEDLLIIKEGPNLRRDLIDDIIVSIDFSYKKTKKEYDKLVFERNKLLKNQNSPYFKEQLDAFDKSIVKYGYKIYKRRKKFINLLNDFARDYHLNLSEGKENLKLTYNPDINAASIEDYYQNFFKKRSDDLRYMTTQKGIHKDDVDILINDKLIKNFGSQGQQRSAILNIKLAQVKLIKEVTGEISVILFDDVFSELDEKRSRFLLENLGGYQTIITATNTKSLDMVDKSSIRYIKNGIIFDN
ncbi:DNA replication/repair protein RecF [Anaerococcus sp.]|uniref:DNA replication/repair protein RecF n=1 Tax=Anaerococcus sp. TaxID=1872515 RepID=UPI0029040BD9|nr:DNA replication/repair protein RecF [Anaerococcus sp.]MDU1828041.1 DNA replication/repair protein RecF [Anaerococcus sp.]MDU1864536.1 DNA replication/repair protein RecF [Anaerococcus sp.]